MVARAVLIIASLCGTADALKVKVSPSPPSTAATPSPTRADITKYPNQYPTPYYPGKTSYCKMDGSDDPPSIVPCQKSDVTTCPNLMCTDVTGNWMDFHDGERSTGFNGFGDYVFTKNDGLTTHRCDYSISNAILGSLVGTAGYEHIQITYEATVYASNSIEIRWTNLCKNSVGYIDSRTNKEMMLVNWAYVEKSSSNESAHYNLAGATNRWIRTTVCTDQNACDRFGFKGYSCGGFVGEQKYCRCGAGWTFDNTDVWSPCRMPPNNLPGKVITNKSPMNGHRTEFNCSFIDYTTFSYEECSRPLAYPRKTSNGEQRFFATPGSGVDPHRHGFKEVCPCQTANWCSETNIKKWAAYNAHTSMQQALMETPAARLTNCPQPTPFPTPVPTAAPTNPPPTPAPTPVGETLGPTPVPTSPTPAPTWPPTPAPSRGVDKCGCFRPGLGWNPVTQRCEKGPESGLVELRCCSEGKIPKRVDKASGGQKDICVKKVEKIGKWYTYLPLGLGKPVAIIMTLVEAVVKMAMNVVFSWKQQYPEATNLEILPAPAQETITKAYELHMKAKEEAKSKGVEWAF